MFKFIFAFTFFINSGLLVQSQQLPVCIELDEKFPFNLSTPEAIYDGLDSIYLFGGFKFGSPNPGSDEILRFSISSEIVEQVGRLPWYMNAGRVTKDGLGDFYYIGGNEYGGSSSREIYKFSPATGNVTRFSRLPYTIGFTAAFQFNSTTSIIINGGSPGEILTFDTVSGNVSKIFQLPNGLSYTNVFWKDWDKVAVILGQSAIVPETQLLLYSPIDNSLTTLNRTLPFLSATPATTASPSFGYAIGGFEQYYTKVLRLNLVSFEIDYLDIEGYPGNEELYFYDTATVYVERLNRIYLFGGRSYNISCGAFCGHIQHNQIWYIQLP